MWNRVLGFSKMSNFNTATKKLVLIETKKNNYKEARKQQQNNCFKSPPEQTWRQA